MICHQYILDNEFRPVPEPDLLKWARWFEDAKRQVTLHKLGPVRVSTVFLGLDHSFRSGSPPVLWETMIFGGKLDGAQARCSGNKEQAEAMHVSMHKELIADWRNFTWRKFSNRKRRLKALRKMRKIPHA